MAHRTRLINVQLQLPFVLLLALSLGLLLCVVRRLDNVPRAEKPKHGAGVASQKNTLH